MKDDISKTITFMFTNAFTKQWMVKAEMPYKPFLASDGYYSSLYKRMRKATAIGMELSLIRGKKYFTTKKVDRLILSYPSGVVLDAPFDLTKSDVKIIKHYLEGIKMSLVNDQCSPKSHGAILRRQNQNTPIKNDTQIL